jgi:hypothetical protein
MVIEAIDEVDNAVLQSADTERMDNVNDFDGILHDR